VDEFDQIAAKHLRIQQPVYEKFLRDVLQDLYRFKDRSSLANSIYRIYSRADKQLNARILKSEEGVANTLRKWSSTNSKARVSDLHDIIGVTIVTYFDSEVSAVVEALRKREQFEAFFGSFDFVESWEKPNKEERERQKGGGYFATHCKVARAENVSTTQLFCEIQVKSLLNDGWAAKIHDLVYKSKSPVDPDVERQAEVIGGMVNALEQMSDGLRILITRNQQVEAKRRTAAASSLMRATLDSMAESGTSAERAWYKTLEEGLNHFRICEDNDPKLAALMASWRKEFGDQPRTQIGCRLLLLLALERGSQHAADDALSAIEEWAASLTTPTERVRAIRFRATAHWILRQFEEAVSTCRSLVESGEVVGVSLAQTKIDLAYYLAEQCFHRDNECTSAIRDEIYQLVKSWEAEVEAQPENEVKKRIRMSGHDSIGAIQIMISPTSDGVFAGHQLCTQARDWASTESKDTEVFEAFYKLHTERARRRIQEIPPQ